VEAMNEGAVTLSHDGTILYCNGRFAEMLETSHKNILGHSIYEFVASVGTFEPAFQKSKTIKEKVEGSLKKKDKPFLPVYLSLNPLLEDEVPGICVVVTDLEVLKENEKQLKNLTSQLISAQEDERKRIAHDIHDSLGSQLSAVKFKVEDFLKMVPAASEGITSALQDAINESRRIQMDLHPSMLDDLGIAPTLAWFCRKFETTYSLPIEQKMSIDEGQIPKPLKRVIYRVCQEALNNVAKHSKAKKVYLSLNKNCESIELVVQDNGKGFELAAGAPKKGIGLSSMKERTEVSGGILSIESERGKGTVVRACWPL
jgi:signal transduction histidine kinase